MQIMFGESADLLHINAHSLAAAAVHAVLGIKNKGVRRIGLQRTRRAVGDKAGAKGFDFLRLRQHGDVEKALKRLRDTLAELRIGRRHDHALAHGVHARISGPGAINLDEAETTMAVGWKIRMKTK
jgi:hypothetical protein